MWVLTPRGFYSVVANHEDPDKVLVRARVREDLERLADLVEDGVTILETPERDYRFRAVLLRQHWSNVAALLAGEVDYPNFKAEVERRQGHARADVYGRVWAALYRLQQER